jgi:hypothetical protein
MAEFDRLTISSYASMGKLIKTWALGEDRVKNGGVYLPKPRTLDEFCRMLKDANAAQEADIKAWRDSFGPQFKKIKFMQTTPDTLCMRLPMKEMVVAKEAELKAGKAYSLPAFYGPGFFSGAAQKAPSPAAAALDAHDERVGDYSIAQCG